MLKAQNIYFTQLNCTVKQTFKNINHVKEVARLLLNEFILYIQYNEILSKIQILQLFKDKKQCREFIFKQ